MRQTEKKCCAPLGLEKSSANFIITLSILNMIFFLYDIDALTCFILCMLQRDFKCI
jgi:hypothetical protein